MYPLTPAHPFICLSFTHLSSHIPSALPLVHSFIFVFPFAPNHPFFLPAAYTSMHPYLLCTLHLCASTSLSLMFSHPAILHPPTHPIHPSTTHPFTHHPSIHASVHIYPSTHSFTCYISICYPPLCPSIHIPHIQSTHHLPIHTSANTSACPPTKCYLLTLPSIKVSTHYPSIYLSI